jgi:phosphate transporter
LLSDWLSILAMGGIALGKGVMSSGLLGVMDVIVRDLVEGRSLFVVVLLLSPVVLVRNLEIASAVTFLTKRNT